MSYMSSEQGPQSIMDQFVAGIKVGQVMTKARIAGMDVAKAPRHTLDNSPTLDLEGDLSWA